VALLPPTIRKIMILVDVASILAANNHLSLLFHVHNPSYFKQKSRFSCVLSDQSPCALSYFP